MNTVERQGESATAATAESLVFAIRKGTLAPAARRHALSFLPPPQLERVAELLETDPSHRAEAAALAGHAAYRRRHYAMAAGALTAAVAAGQRPSEDHLVLAHALIVEGRMTEAAAAVEGCPGIGSGAADAAWAAALFALAQGAYLRGLEALRSIAGSHLPLGLSREEMEWLIGYLEAALGSKPTTRSIIVRCLGKRWSAAHRSADAKVVLGLLDYKSPELQRSSRNIGDMVQTIAVLRHIMRFRGARLSYDDPTLRGPADRLAATWLPEEQKPTPATRIHLAVLDRDEPWAGARFHASRDIWLIVSGWLMHRSFDIGRPMPFPANVHPIFVGLHLAVSDHLDDQLTAYLKTHEPIGCRDWSTVWWLLNRGIKAFFSGCLTLTFAAPGPSAPRSGRLAVDLPPGSSDHLPGEVATHQVVPTLRIGEAADHAIDLLTLYASTAEVTTSRLHALLPCLALGTSVAFRPRKASDRRFDGLDDLSPDRLQALRVGLTAIMEELLAAIVLAAPAASIRALWTRLTQGAVDEAQARFAAAKSQSLSPAVVRNPVERPPPSPPTVVLAFDAAYAPYVPTVVRSCAAGSGVPVEYVLLARAIDDDGLQKLTAALSGHCVVLLRAEDHQLDASGVPGSSSDRIFVDRLFLPKLLPDRDRIVCLDVDTVVIGDVAELAAMPLSDLGIAARADPAASTLANAFEIWADRANRDAAREFRRFAAASTNLWAPCLDCGVLVLSLETLRRHDFTGPVVDIMRRFGAPGTIAMNAVVNGCFHPLPAEWNAIPPAEWVERPKLVHFRGARKPWARTRPPRLAGLWRAHAGAVVPLATRRPTPPPLKVASPADGLRPIGDAEYWSDPANYVRSWDTRAARAAALIEPGKTVLDLGCGRMALRSLLPQGCRYIPADLTKWSDDVIVVDLNRQEFPGGSYDYVVMLGVLEYLQSPPGVLREARRHASKLIVSFALRTAGGNVGARQANRWIQHYRAGEFEAVLADCGWTITDRIRYRETAHARQMIYRATADSPAVVADPGKSAAAPTRALSPAELRKAGVLLDQASAAAMTGDGATVFALAQAAASTAPDDYGVVANAARLLQRFDHHAAAVAVCRRGSLLSPADHRLRWSLIQSLKEAGLTDDLYLETVRLLSQASPIEKLLPQDKFRIIQAIRLATPIVSNDKPPSHLDAMERVLREGIRPAKSSPGRWARLIWLATISKQPWITSTRLKRLPSRRAMIWISGPKELSRSQHIIGTARPAPKLRKPPGVRSRRATTTAGV